MRVHLISWYFSLSVFSAFYLQITLMESQAEKFTWQETVDCQRAIILTKKTKQKGRKI